MRDRRAGLGAVVAALGLLLSGCGEPDVDLVPPARPPGAHVYDETGVVGASVDDRLATLGSDTGFDVVVLAYEDERATLGQADRAGRVLLEAWSADVVLVAVAFPGDFENPDPGARQRFFGVTATDRFTVTRDMRERIVEEAVPPPAADNDWSGAFHAAIDALEADLAAEGT